MTTRLMVDPLLAGLMFSIGFIASFVGMTASPTCLLIQGLGFASFAITVWGMVRLYKLPDA